MFCEQITCVYNAGACERVCGQKELSRIMKPVQQLRRKAEMCQRVSVSVFVCVCVGTTLTFVSELQMNCMTKHVMLSRLNLQGLSKPQEIHGKTFTVSPTPRFY